MNKNNDIISRRRFFKHAAGKTLPFLAIGIFGPVMTSCGGDEPDSPYDPGSGNGCSDCSNSSYSGSSGCTGSSCSSNCANSSNGNNGNTDVVSKADGTIGGHEYIDLGVSVKWALCNLDAPSPASDGMSYKAAATKGNDNPTIHQSILQTLGNVKDFSGTSVDNATKQWGKYWRTPTKEEVKELSAAVKVKSFTYKGSFGYLVTSKKNNKSIFFTDRNYWTSSLDKSAWMSGMMYNLPGLYPAAEFLDKGCYIRAVTDMKANPEGCSGSSCSKNCANNNANSGGGCNGSACTKSCANDCDYGCYGNCQAVCSSCSGKCQDGCMSSCQHRAEAGCGGGCTGTCSGRCSDTCSNHCYSSCKNVGKF